MTYAGFWKRFAAYLIDTILISCVMGIIMLVFGIGLFTSMATVDPMEMDEDTANTMAAGVMGGMMTFFLLLSAAQWLYFALMESSAKQATLGKMALSIIVTDMSGNRLSFGRATGRYFGKILSGAILMIGYIMAGFTEKKQALHDMIASCLVVMK